MFIISVDIGGYLERSISTPIVTFTEFISTYSRLSLSWTFKRPGDLFKVEKVQDIETLTKWAVFRRFNTI